MPRADRDESYVIDLIDRLLGRRAERQRRFPFLLGDPGSSGRRTMLPVDAFYAEFALAIEFHEQQHRRPIAHFDKPDRLTISGVHRGEQRRIYDQRRRELLPANGITLVEIASSELSCLASGRLQRVEADDLAVLRRILLLSGVHSTQTVDGGPGVRLVRGRE